MNRPARSSRLLRDATVTIASRVGLAVLIFATDILLARALGPAAKGRFALVLLYSQIAATIVGLGMDQALAVMSGRGKEDGRRAFSNALIWSAVAGGAAMLVSLWLYGASTAGPATGPLADLIPNLSHRQFVFAAVAVPAELLFGFGLFAMLGRRRIAAYAVLRVARRGTLLAMLAAIALVTHVDLGAALAVNIASLGLTLVVVVAVAHRDGLIGGRPSAQLFAEQFRFGLQAAPGVVAERLQFRVDSFFVNLFTGIRATGVYSVTSGLAETLWYVPNAVGQVMFSRAVDPLADAGRTAAVLTRTTLAVTILLAVPAFAFGPRFVRLVYGPVFVDAGVGLRLILPGVVAYSVVAILTRYLTGSGRPGLGSFILAVGLVANIAANLALVPQFGINGAAAASSISYSLTAILTVAAFNRVSGLSVAETLLIKRSDIAAVAASARDLSTRIARRGRTP